ncbi:MAG: HEAT repeat domain-containing protein, partial [Gemmatimonadota bacterium]|nr:HEAT repeat domain-containing protein [Gemmatimonadota bacterium]
MTPTLPLPFGDEIFWLLSLSIVVVVISAASLTLAAVVLRVRNNRVARRWAALEAAWDPLMLAVLAGDRPPGDLARTVAVADARQFLTYLVRYARRVKGRDRAVLQQFAEPYLPLALAELRDRRAERRAAAAQVLGELGPQTYRTQLVGALEDPAPLVVVIAAEALARDYAPEHAPALLDRLARLELWTVRFLVSMLQRMGPESAWIFRDALADAARPVRLRTIAANVLAVFNDLPAGDIAAHALDGADDTDLRVAL